MLQLLLSLLALVLSIGAQGNLQKSPEDIIAKIESQIADSFQQEGPGNLAPEQIPPVSTPSASLNQEHQTPNTEKVLTYNTRGENVVGQVPEVAVQNAKPLVACLEVPESCSPTLTPTPTPTPSPPPVVYPDPEPIPDPIHPVGPCPPVGAKPPFHPLVDCRF